jgi:dienelactone hydrolase
MAFVKAPARALLFVLFATSIIAVSGQEYSQPDRGEPGDEMIQAYLKAEAEKIEADFLGNIKTAEDWQRERPRLVQEYYEMLGLWPLPDRTPLNATIVRTLDRGEYLVDMLHYQSRPGLYVTANLYRPAGTQPGQKLPAVLYVCGHSGRGRNGNKSAFQSHGIWFARHGYVCLMVDTLQLGEIAGIHHGTYREERWWWLSRGYTPAGVECWNGVRGIDYLLSRSDVDADRIAVTGISGGGAATFWIAAADERVKIAAPVSGMADLVSYIPSRMINGHCDCMFLYNAHQWHWTRIAGLIAPRPQLFVNSDLDPIFPMDANERIINRLERLYSLFGASDDVDSFVSVGGHDYRKDIRQATYRFVNSYFKNDRRPVLDSEVDLVVDRPQSHPIPPEELRVFPKDSDFPADALNGSIDRHFVPLADPGTPSPDNFDIWKNTLLGKLRKLTFNHFPENVPAASAANSGRVLSVLTEENIKVRLRRPAQEPEEIVLQIANGPLEENSDENAWVLEPRGLGETRWTRKNPPNYVERSHYLLGRTVDSGRVWDIIATAKFIKGQHPDKKLVVQSEGRGAVLALYAALLDPAIEQLRLGKVPSSLMESESPALLNALRVCDIPHVIKMLAPRKVEITGGN